MGRKNIESKVQDEVLIDPEDDEVVEVVDPKKEHIFLRIIKIIFLVITAPLWVPWKILFVRRKTRKFKDMSTPIKVFRVLRAPITLPLKFALFLVILSVEMFAVYKIRYSPVTYPITRASVRSYYLVKNDSKANVGFITVNAVELSNHYDEFKTAFDYIDKWDLDSKNKMYVILNSYATKYVVNIVDDTTLSYLLNRFNDDESLRSDIKKSVKDVNKLIKRSFNEVLQYDDLSEVSEYTGVNVASIAMLDYSQLLDIAGNAIKIVESMPNVEVPKMKDEDFDQEAIDIAIDALRYYVNGHNLKQTEKYLTKRSEGYKVNVSDVTTTEIKNTDKDKIKEKK